MRHFSGKISVLALFTMRKIAMTSALTTRINVGHSTHRQASSLAFVSTTLPEYTRSSSRKSRYSSSSSLETSASNTSQGLEYENENPTLQWSGKSLSTSEFVIHVLVPIAASRTTVILNVAQALQQQQQSENAKLKRIEAELQKPHDETEEWQKKASELVELGSVWLLSKEAPRNPSLGGKPMRLTRDQLNQTLDAGDYLRIHFDPRRFPMVHKYDWNAPYDNETSTESLLNGTKPGLIVAEDTSKGWLVINKPMFVPVHMTVDNSLENVQSCIYQARRQVGDKIEDDLYVSTPQRLDQNTSGLVVIATSKGFAGYFAKLLRKKTAKLADGVTKTEESNQCLTQGVHKVYKCLGCLAPPSQSKTQTSSSPSNQWSVRSAVHDLQQTKGKLVRHWLEPSIRAPKLYHEQLPADWENDAKSGGGRSWQEALLRIIHVGDPLAIIGNEAGETLAMQLWGGENVGAGKENYRKTSMRPQHCQAVVELQIELLTGRTHQIRGQLAAMNIPIVGDTPYGGAIPLSGSFEEECRDHVNFPDDKLALQCSQLEFKDPNIVIAPKTSMKRKQERNEVQFVESERWNRFELQRSWWTPMLEQYSTSTGCVDANATTSANDKVLADSKKQRPLTQNQQRQRSEWLPDRVQLSPGKNKYVLIRAYSDNTQEEQEEFWFVKSASPKECGGPYHGNVAQDLRDWIEAAGFKAEVTGGGRIDYHPNTKRCMVYGFSYGFGTGDHERAATIIREHKGIPASFDNTEGLY